MLHVPNIKKNLISVSQLTKDHNLIAELHADSCFIKDKGSGRVLLRGILRDGLYQLITALGCVGSEAIFLANSRKSTIDHVDFSFVRISFSSKCKE